MGSLYDYHSNLTTIVFTPLVNYLYINILNQRVVSSCIAKIIIKKSL